MKVCRSWAEGLAINVLIILSSRLGQKNYNSASFCVKRLVLRVFRGNQLSGFYFRVLRRERLFPPRELTSSA